MLTLQQVHICSELEGDAHSSYILLEFGAAHTLLIEISAPDEPSWNDLVQAAMPIVETFQFTHEAGGAIVGDRAALREHETGEWSRHSDLNRGPAVYETAALPLSYVGASARV